MSDKNRKNLESIFTKTRMYLAVIGILLIILCVQNLLFIPPAVLLYSVLLVYTFWTNNKNKTELDKHIQELSFNVDSIAKNTLINSPFPLVIAEENGNLTWKSASFVSEFGNIDIKNILTDVIKETIVEIEKSEQKNDKQVIYKQIKIGKKDYKIIIETIATKERNKKRKDEVMLVMYFVDNTNLLEASRRLEESRTCVGLIMIDSYEELVQNLGQEEKTQLVTEIETKVYDWVSEVEGIALKTDANRICFIFEEKHLEKIIENKFEILKQTKDTETEGIIQPTLSIAICAEGNSNADKFKLTMEAMDLVLGRGGDQAVIRRKGKYEFYGGKKQEVEKRTKVKARTITTALEELIEATDSILIMGHSNGDIDSMGSSLGVYRIVKSLNKEAKIVKGCNN